MSQAVISIFGLGTGEIVIILVVVLLLFGARRIPELAKGMGKGIREFKDASREIQREIEREPVAEPKAPAPTTSSES